MRTRLDSTNSIADSVNDGSECEPVKRGIERSRFQTFRATIKPYLSSLTKKYVAQNRFTLRLFALLLSTSIVSSILINFTLLTGGYECTLADMLFGIRRFAVHLALICLVFVFVNWLRIEFLTDDVAHNHSIQADKDWEDYMKTVQQETRQSNLRSKVYTLLPLRMLSRVWGIIHTKRLPAFIRVPFMKAFIKFYGLNMDEAEVSDIREYTRMHSLFRRRLKPDARPIDPLSNFVSPVDGRVLSCGVLDDNTDKITQVKGSDYSLKALLGKPMISKTDKSILEISEKEYRQSLMHDPVNNQLYYAVIYLAPGDYHRFHSPADWTVVSRRHFPGDLFSVNPSVASWLKNLFVLNERVALFGTWEHGFMSYTAVGATMVGSIRIYFDRAVTTSKAYLKSGASSHTGYYFDRVYSEPYKIEKGEQIGEFNMGSTVISVFEAPKSFEFNIKEAQVVRLGRSLRTMSGIQVSTCAED